MTVYDEFHHRRLLGLIRKNLVISNMSEHIVQWGVYCWNLFVTQFGDFYKCICSLAFCLIVSSLWICHCTAFLPPLFLISQLLIIFLSPVCYFQDLLCLWLKTVFTVIYLDVVLLVLILFGVSWALWMCMLVYIHILP